MNIKITGNFTVALVLLFGIAFGQVDHIQINGHVDTTIIDRYLCNQLIVSEKYSNNRHSQGKRYKIDIDKNGYLKSKPIRLKSLTYLSFEFEDKRETNGKGTLQQANPLLQRPMKEVYLFEPGDSVFLDIKEDGRILFYGKGSEKQSCQSLIYNIDPVPYSFDSRISMLNDINEILKLTEESIRISIRQRLRILNTYKKQLPEKIYNLLYLDAIASAEYPLNDRVYNYALNRKPEDLHFINQYYRSYLTKNQDWKIAPAYLEESAYYADMLFMSLLTSLEIKNKLDKSSISPFNQLLDSIEKNYQGKLREKLMFICFERLVMTYSIEARLKVKDILLLMKSNLYRELLTNLMSRQELAYPFDRLYDITNKEHKLSDYSGKLIIMDIWFTGCTSCIFLAEAMHPIFEKYKNNKEVVFITISTDPKNIWIKSVASGEYCSPGMINLHTGGLGFKHPLIANYNFLGAPNLLIIGKNGHMITSTAPKPIGEENKKAFIKLIDENK